MKMQTIEDVLTEMKALKARWVDPEVIDDAEEMLEEIPPFLDQAVPILEEYLKRHA